jgi:hypothetical protein
MSSSSASLSSCWLLLLPSSEQARQLLKRL